MKSENFKPLAIFRGYTGWFVSDLVRNPKDRSSHDAAHRFFFAFAFTITAEEIRCVFDVNSKIISVKSS